MVSYAKVASRKRLVKDNFKKVIKFFTGTSNEHSNIKPFYSTLWSDIKDGLDYGFDINYTTYGGDIYKPSLEGAYIEYFGNKPTDTELEKLYNVLTTEILPHYISKYDDLNFTTGESEYGRTFTIEYK